MPAQRPRFAVRLSESVYVLTVYLVDSPEHRRLTCATATSERKPAAKWTLHMAQAIARANGGQVVTG